jgi:hypothetical protein
MKWKRILKWSALAILVVLFAWFEFAYWTSTNDCGRSIPSDAERMKAIRYCEYGSPDDVLKLEEVEKPVPNENQILVRVRAVSLRFSTGACCKAVSAGCSSDFASQETPFRDPISPEQLKRLGRT